MSQKLPEISTAAANAAGEDRISSLPDEIIHEILARSDRPEQAAKVIVLSKRWAHLWRSYPNLEFSYDRHLETTELSLQRFAAAAHKKFDRRHGSSTVLAAGIVRIRVPLGYCHAFVDDMFKLAAEISPREVDFSVGSVFPYEYTIPREFCSCWPRLKVLKLQGCVIDNPNFPCFGSSLQVLCLSFVVFQDRELLCSLISGASLLETLELKSLRIPPIRNHPSLKTLKICSASVKDFEIAGARSLETLHLVDFGWDDCAVSSTPNLKVLHIQSARKLTNRKLNELISMVPSLESLILDDPYGSSTTDELKIVNRSKLREITLLGQVQVMDIEMDIEIDVPSLKTLKICSTSVTNFKNAGSPSLETLHLVDFVWHNCAVSSTPNLKVLHIKRARELTNRKLSELISMVPSLELLILDDPYRSTAPDELKIVNRTKLRHITLLKRLQVTDIEIDVPSLTNFNFEGDCFKRCPNMLVRPCSQGASARFTFDCTRDMSSNELKKLLTKLSRFRLTLELRSDREVTWSKLTEDELPTPLIEHVKVSFELVDMFGKHAFQDMFFRICLPKCLSFIGLMNRASVLVYLCGHFTARASDIEHCEAACECWRHRLKDVKMVKEDGEGSITEYETLEIHTTVLPSLARNERIWFDLTWD